MGELSWTVTLNFQIAPKMKECMSAVSPSPFHLMHPLRHSFLISTFTLYLLSAYTLYNTPFLLSGSFYLYNLVGKTGQTQRKFKKHKWHEDIRRQHMNKKPERAKTRILRGRNNQRCYRKEVLLWWMVKNIGQLSGIHTVDIKGPAHKAICKGCSHYNNLAILFKLAKSWKQLEWPSTWVTK